MVWSHLAANQVLEVINYIISFDFLKKLGRNTLSIVGNWMGRVARAKREAFIKRLRNHRRRRDDCKTMKRSRCAKCSILQKRRVLEPDYLANLAYRNRVVEDNQLPINPFSPEPRLNLEEPKKSRDDHRDLLHSDYNDVAWWTGVNKRVHMPPLKNELPTRSNYSSTSGFRSATFDILQSSDTSTSTSDSSDYESCKERSVTPRPIKLISKSESRVKETPSQRTQFSRTSRSASMPLGHLPGTTTSQLASKIGNKPIKRNKRPVSSDKTATSHVCDALSTCVKCSRIFSNPQSIEKQKHYNSNP